MLRRCDVLGGYEKQRSPTVKNTRQLNETTTQTTEDPEAEFKRLEQQTRIALAKAIGKAAKEACTLRLTKKQREKAERIVQQLEAMQKKAKR